MTTDLLTKHDVMIRLKVCQRTVDRLRENGLLPWLNIGSGRKPLVRFRLSDVEQFEARSRQSAEQLRTDAA